MAPTLLLIDNETIPRQRVARALGSACESFRVVEAESGSEGLQKLAEHRIDCVILDYLLGEDRDGLDYLRAIRETHGDLPVVLITAWGSDEVAVQAIKLGATNYVARHGLYYAALLERIREALRDADRVVRSIQRRTRRVTYEVRERYRALGIVGDSAAIEEAVLLADQAAHSAATLLIEGETGTGKDLFARAIHAMSARSRGPFLAQNCAAIPESMLEAELFGWVRGAFTGGDRPRAGLFEAADGGTLFLDEIGETSAGMQAKLLRVLEDGVVRRLGSNEARAVDVRVIAATNRNPRACVELGQFRPDLFFRLNVLPLRLPPLRERPEDVRVLAHHVLRRLAAKEGKRLAAIDARAVQALTAYPWPGNVRELENELHRIVVGAAPTEEIVTVAMLDSRFAIARQLPADREPTLREVKEECIRRTIRDRLRKYGYKRKPTAASLGISREWLWDLMKELEITVEDDEDVEV